MPFFKLPRIALTLSSVKWPLNGSVVHFWVRKMEKEAFFRIILGPAAEFWFLLVSERHLESQKYRQIALTVSGEPKEWLPFPVECRRPLKVFTPVF